MDRFVLDIEEIVELVVVVDFELVDLAGLFQEMDRIVFMFGLFGQNIDEKQKIKLK